MVEKSLLSRQEAKIRELESRLEFEKTQVKRLEVSVKLRWRGAGSGPRRAAWRPCRGRRSGQAEERSSCSAARSHLFTQKSS